VPRTGPSSAERRALERARDLEEVGMIVRTAARRIADSDGATVVLRENDSCFYADEDSVAPLWKGQRFPMTECISGWAMLHGEVAVVPDIELDPRIPLAAYRPTYVRSLAMVPVGVPAVGAIGAYWSSTDRATDAIVSGLCDLAEHAADAIAAIGLTDAPWAPNFRMDPAT